MAYDCPYSTDRGCRCSRYVKDGEKYCVVHKADILQIDALEKEINEVIKKAREK